MPLPNAISNPPSADLIRSLEHALEALMQAHALARWAHRASTALPAELPALHELDQLRVVEAHVCETLNLRLLDLEPCRQRFRPGHLRTAEDEIAATPSKPHWPADQPREAVAVTRPLIVACVRSCRLLHTALAVARDAKDQITATLVSSQLGNLEKHLWNLDSAVRRPPVASDRFAFAPTGS